MQHLQHLKYSIIAGLDALSEDNLAVLAKFIAFLRNETPAFNVVQPFVTSLAS